MGRALYSTTLLEYGSINEKAEREHDRLAKQTLPPLRWQFCP